jgi:hypothetical protein
LEKNIKEENIMSNEIYQGISQVANQKSGDFRVYGKVVFAAKPEKREGNKGSFYTQKIYIKDDSCDKDTVLKPSVIIGGSESNKINVGDKVDIVGNINKRGDKVYYNGKLYNPEGKPKVENDKVEEEKQVKEKVEKEMEIFNGNSNGYGTKDNYWVKKFDWEMANEKKRQGSIARSVAVNNATTLLANKVIAKDEYWDWVHNLAGYSLLGKYPKTNTDSNDNDKDEVFDIDASLELDQEIAETEEGNTDFDPDLFEKGAKKQKKTSKS